MQHEAHIVHEMPGRFRLRVPSRVKDAEYFKRVREELQIIPEISLLETNSTTGSILVEYIGDAQTIFDAARERDLFRVSRPKPALHEPLSLRLSQSLRDFDRSVSSFTKGELDAAALISMLLGAAGAVQFAKKKVWPAGATLLWYAVNVLLARSAKSAGGGAAGSPVLRLQPEQGPTPSPKDRVAQPRVN
jgi:hypothetical protein